MCRSQRYETTKSGEHGEETGHHQTSHTATQDVQNCGTSRTGCLETLTLRGKGETNNPQMRVLKQMTREARKRIYHLGKLRKIIQKVQTSRTGRPRRAAPSHEASGASRFKVFDPFAETMGLPES